MKLSARVDGAVAWAMALIGPVLLTLLLLVAFPGKRRHAGRAVGRDLWRVAAAVEHPGDGGSQRRVVFDDEDARPHSEPPASGSVRNYLWTFIQRLRRKLEDDPHDPRVTSTPEAAATALARRRVARKSHRRADRVAGRCRHPRPHRQH